jgi:hypothetical protein
VPEVQVVMDMDGFGAKFKTFNLQNLYFREPVQFTGFKLLQNDNWNKLDHVHSEELLQLTPKPSYIQFQ